MRGLSKQYQRLFVRAAAFSVVAVSLAACAGRNTATAVVDTSPETPPVAATSNFRQALVCLDGLLTRAQLPTTDIVVGQMPDTTGELRVGLRDMTMNALGKASTRSGAFRVIDAPILPLDRQPISGAPLTSVSSVPDLDPTSLHVSGSIVSFNRRLIDSGVTLGGGNLNNSAGVSFVTDLGTVTTGMRVSRFATHEQLYNEQHTLTLRRDQQGGDVFATIGGVTPFLELNFDRADSPAAAVQALVDLHVVELLGKVSGVAYWRCLSGTDKAGQEARKAGELWRELDQSERERRVVAALGTLGYSGPDAIARFQADNGLLASGGVDFASFLAVARAAPGALQTASTKVAAVSATPEVSNEISIQLRNLGSSQRPIWRTEVAVAQSAYVICFHQDSDGAISRIYPNPLQPDARRGASATLFVPNTIAEKRVVITGFGLRFLCAATPEPALNQLGPAYQSPAFVALTGNGIFSFAQIFDDLTSSFPGSVAVAERTTP